MKVKTEMETNEEKDEVCPKCGNHCSPDELRCRRGMEYFGVKTEEKGERRPSGRPEPDISTLSTDDAVIMLLRKSGHYLHHNAGHGEGINQALLSALTEEEKKTLVELLKKCTRDWS